MLHAKQSSTNANFQTPLIPGKYTTTRLQMQFIYKRKGTKIDMHFCGMINHQCYVHKVYLTVICLVDHGFANILFGHIPQSGHHIKNGK